VTKSLKEDLRALPGRGGFSDCVEGVSEEKKQDRLDGARVISNRAGKEGSILALKAS